MSEYVLESFDLHSLLEQAEKVYDLVWRFDFTAPGFAVVDVDADVDSLTLRAWMMNLKERLSEISVARERNSFGYRSMSRFDQQVTTKFHLDGAPAESLLMLGYEPSKVQSRLFLADYTRAAFDLGLTPEQFLKDFSPMYKRGEDALENYLAELPQPGVGQSRIVLINNSSLPFTESRTNALGVMHKAIIVTPDETERRIVNSTMLVAGPYELRREQQEDFAHTDKISERAY